MTVRPVVWLAAVLVVALDLFTKQWALNSLEPGERVTVVGDYLSLQLVFNSGAAFSLGEGYTWVLTLVALAVTVGIIYYARRARTGWAIGLAGIALGGAVGNLIDRVFRAPGFAQGHVVDFINYANFFVGNVADIAIVGAAIAFMALSLFGKDKLTGGPSEVADAPADSGDDAEAPAS